MTFTEAFDELRALAAGRYCCLHVEASQFSRSVRTEVEWWAYVDGYGHGENARSAEAALDNMRVKMAIPQADGVEEIDPVVESQAEGEAAQ